MVELDDWKNDPGQGDSKLDAIAGHDQWREPQRPSYAPFYGARHDRSGIPRDPASERSLTSQRGTLSRTNCPPPAGRPYAPQAVNKGKRKGRRGEV